jgi:hypothetical protein
LVHVKYGKGGLVLLAFSDDQFHDRWAVHHSARASGYQLTERGTCLATNLGSDFSLHSAFSR